ncbi:sodium-coupled monocarboxylate transporter 1-like isoform X2 [Babylonia areolata]|uniref:sodium-coupled monocarboxylate transporter 1-like isoform X2 n=1 Tax=Babylonia areolata TaxID=304850 RepID=UPI003FCF38E2
MEGEDYSIYTGVVRTFHPVDYVLFALTLLVSSGIGIFYALWDRRRNTPEEFLLGGHKMHVVPVAMSLMVTFVSSLTLLGYPAEMYNYNTMFWWLTACFVVAVGGSVLIFIPFFHRLGVTSTFEYLEMRFNKTVRLMGSVMMICQTWLYIASLLYAPSLSLHAVTGINLWGSVVAMGIVVTFYTTLGGMKAVLWTDTFQAGVIMTGLVAVIVRGLHVQGGVQHVWHLAANRSRIVFDEFSVDPTVRHSVWSMVLGSGLYWMSLYGVNQSQVQRCLSCPTVRKARVAMLLSFPGLVIIVSMACFLGVIMFAFYADCDPIRFGLIEKSDQLVPLYVMDVLGTLHGLPGIFVSAIVSGSLSSLSSGLNALSAITYSDFLVGLGWRSRSAFHSTLISKLLVLVYGVGAMGLAWFVAQMGGILQALYVMFGVLNGPLLGVFTLGMFFPWANSWGAVAGQVVATTFLAWVGLGAFFNNVHTPKSPTSVLACNWTALAAAASSTSTTIISNTTTISTLTRLNSTFVQMSGDLINQDSTTTTTTTAAATAAASDAGVLEPLYRLSYMWYTAVGMIIVWTVGLLVSFVTGPTKPDSLKPALLCPIVDVLFPWLPDACRKPFRCGREPSKVCLEKSDSAAEELEMMCPLQTETIIDGDNKVSRKEGENGNASWQKASQHNGTDRPGGTHFDTRL